MAAISARGSGGRRTGIVGINVTPLVDVVLVLLIIMMVSATYVVSQSLKVELPKTATSDGSAPTTYVVAIREDGSLLYNDAPTSLEQLGGQLKQAVANAGTNLSLIVSADRAAKHGSVVEVIDAAKLVGITKFAINVERSKTK
jgi:biopolymer transport protein ExbD